MAKSVDEQIEKFFKIRANIDGAGWYEKIHGANVGEIKFFPNGHPDPQNRNEWKYIGPDSAITTVEDGIAKDAKTKLENLFTGVIDQVSFGTTDWNRFRKFLVDLYASHRTLTTYSTQITDPHSLTNSDLDELFRSFGYPHSASLHGSDENPLEQKIQFFLDLVNLYKVKGTPQSLVDVLQYYGVTELDIYEFFLKLKDQNSLFFEGKAVAGTTIDPNIINFPYSNLTSGDPHWLYTEQQILQLNRNLNINLPSKSPYIGIQPIVDLEGSEVSILIRKVQDQYDYYNNTGNLPAANAEITYIREVRTLLELYLSTLYMFNNLFDVGIEPSSDRGYLCYDGTNTSSVDIINEFNIITQAPTSRAGQKIQLDQYYDVFSRFIPTNFLVNKNSAGNWLNIIAPDIKVQLDASGDPLNVLYSLFKDIAIWVRNNIGLGFINFGFILFGIEEFFKDLKPVINFFKPYRARLLLLESLQIRNRLFNSILLEDEMSVGVDLTFHDFLTGDSSPCCGEDTTCLIICDECNGTTQCKREYVNDTTSNITWKGLWVDGVVYAINDVIPDANNTQYICTHTHISGTTTKPPTGVSWSSYWEKLSQIVCIDTTTGASYYSRETYDCGSAYDYGAVVDKEINIDITEEVRDHLRCPAADGTANIVFSDLVSPTDATSVIPVTDGTTIIDYEYYQSSGFRDFDEEGTFDCTHGFDLVHITSCYVPKTSNYLMQENFDPLLNFNRITQENGCGILL